MTSEPDEYFLDPRAVRRAFDAASKTYASAAGIQDELRHRLLERLDLVRVEPTVVLDLGAGLGESARSLKDRYRSAQVVALDLSEAMLARARRQQRFLRRFHRLAADAHRLPLKAASADLVFSNLMLEWCASPDEVFCEVRRVLRPHGLFTFTTLGPDTLREVREAWRGVDAHPHVNRFIDMHDLGDALMRARFAEPVMDVERLSVTYADVDALRRELRNTGSRNLSSGRSRSLTPRGRGRAFKDALADRIENGRLSISLEVIYGHAWAGEPRIEAGPKGEFRVPLTVLKGRRPDPRA